MSTNNANSFSIIRRKNNDLSYSSLSNNMNGNNNKSTDIKKRLPFLNKENKIENLTIDNNIQFSFLNKEDNLLIKGKKEKRITTNNLINYYTFKKEENDIDNNEEIKMDNNKLISGLINEKSIKNLEYKSDNSNIINNTSYSKDSNSYKKETKKGNFIIILNDKYNKILSPIKNDLISIQSFLLKIIFMRLWKKKTFLQFSLKKQKELIKKDKNFEKNINNINSKKKIINNNHILLTNLMAYIFDKIKKEVWRRKLIICFKNINLLKYPNLHFAMKKIKKFSKVRYKVMNEFASIIQNAFRYYLENKNKEQNQEAEIETDINNQKFKEGI